MGTMKIGVPRDSKSPNPVNEGPLNHYFNRP